MSLFSFDRKRLHTLLASALCSSEILVFYKSHSSWFTERRLRRLVYHTSTENNHMTMPLEALHEYASRLVSMEEAFLLWFKGLSNEEKRFLALLIEFPILNAEKAYKTAGLWKNGYVKKEIARNIKEKDKYVLENVAVYQNGFVFCPAILRRYIAVHLSTLEEYSYLKKIITPRHITVSEFEELLNKKDIQNDSKNELSQLKNKNALTIQDAINFLSENGFIADVLLPHLHLNSKRWLCPATKDELKDYAEKMAAFFQSELFATPVSFSDILFSCNDDILNAIPHLFKGKHFSGYFLTLLSDDLTESSLDEKRAKLNSSEKFFGRRISLLDTQTFIYSFVELPMLHNIALVLCQLGFFSCTFAGKASDLEKASGVSLFQYGQIELIKAR